MKRYFYAIRCFDRGISESFSHLGEPCEVCRFTSCKKRDLWVEGARTDISHGRTVTFASAVSPKFKIYSHAHGTVIMVKHAIFREDKK